MPYVKQEVRGPLDAGYIPTDVGQLNYVITKAMIKGRGKFYIRDIILNYWAKSPKHDYATIDGIAGALVLAVIERFRRTGDDQFDMIAEVLGDFYRMVGVPYENKKINENGDVYTTGEGI